MLSNKETKSLKKIINIEINRARRHSYEHIKNILVCNTRETLNISREVANTLTKSTDCVRKAIETHPEIKKVIQNRRAFFTNNTSCAAVAEKNVPFISGYIKVIALRNITHIYTNSAKYTLKTKLADNFNHEIGHWLIKGGVPQMYDSLEKCHLSECIAEAYKALRHKQLFGNDTNFADNNNYSHSIVLGESPIHYKDVVIQKVETLADKLAERDIYLSQLSYEQTLHLARDIAIKYHFKNKTLKKIIEAYEPVAEHYRKEYYLDSITPKKVFEVMMTNKNNHHIYRVGKRYLERQSVKKYIDDNDPFWINAKKQMNKAERGNKHVSGIILSLGEAMDIHLGKEAITADDVQAMIKKPHQSLRHQTSFTAP